MLINQLEGVCSYLNISGWHRYSNVNTNTWRDQRLEESVGIIAVERHN